MPRESGSLPTEQLAGWGNFPSVRCRALHPEPEELSSPSESHFPVTPRALTPRGLGRSYGDASLGTDQSVVVITDRCQQVLQLDRHTGELSAQSGTSLETIIDAALPHGWFLPVTPGTRFVTLGGAIAANVHGKNHHLRGAIEHFVQSFDLLTERGLVHCTPAANPELFRATLGGFGLTGIVTRATLRLMPVESAWIETLSVRADSLEELLGTLAERESDYEYSITWVDTAAKGRALGRGVVMLGRHAPRAVLPPHLEDRPLEHRWSTPKSVPSRLGGWVLSPWTFKCLNFAYYHARTGKPKQGLAPIESYFYPLDAIRNWNVLYGKRGFLQYQLVLPDEGDAKTGIRKVLELLSERGVCSFVAGLKRMRRDENLLPFGMDGFTFGIDFGRNFPGIEQVMNELDRIVIEHGGRICLSKDSRLDPQTFRLMYPEFPEWREAVQRIAPQRRFTSLLAERLRLHEA